MLPMHRLGIGLHASRGHRLPSRYGQRCDHPTQFVTKSPPKAPAKFGGCFGARSSRQSTREITHQITRQIRMCAHSKSTQSPTKSGGPIRNPGAVAPGFPLRFASLSRDLVSNLPFPLRPHLPLGEDRWVRKEGEAQSVVKLARVGSRFLHLGSAPPNEH